MNISINFYRINTLNFYRKNNANVNICNYTCILELQFVDLAPYPFLTDFIDNVAK